jgi:hypothetical protein
MKKKFDDGGADSEACDRAGGEGGGQDSVGARWAAMGGSAFLRSCAVTLSIQHLTALWCAQIWDQALGVCKARQNFGILSHYCDLTIV